MLCNIKWPPFCSIFWLKFWQKINLTSRYIFYLLKRCLRIQRVPSFSWFSCYTLVNMQLEPCWIVLRIFWLVSVFFWEKKIEKERKKMCKCVNNPGNSEWKLQSSPYLVACFQATEMDSIACSSFSFFSALQPNCCKKKLRVPFTLTNALRHLGRNMGLSNCLDKECEPKFLSVLATLALS